VVTRILARTPVESRAFGVVTFGTMVPCPTNYVRLVPGAKDAFGMPLLEIHLRVDGGTDDASRTARERFLEILDGSGYRPKVRETATKTPGASVHYGGTVRMHRSARYGMLDGWNRLHAVDNVVVADASSFTTGPEKHPTLTAMALAARACEKLAADLRCWS
jgi:choline dehydrogenase-like flavoprotein